LFSMLVSGKFEGREKGRERDIVTKERERERD
jgi:hypothetical protein